MDITALYNAVVNFFSSFFTDMVSLFTDALTWLLNGFILVIGYVVLYVLEGFFTVITTVVGMLDFSSLALDLVGQLGILPPAMIFLLRASGFTTGLSIVIAAYTIRLTLNLIPGAFTRI